MTWARAFDTPIPLPDGGELKTLRDAGEYVAGRPDAEMPHWQIAVRHLLWAAERGGILLLAEIAMRQALNHGRPMPVPGPRKKPAKRYRLIR